MKNSMNTKNKFIFIAILIFICIFHISAPEISRDYLKPFSEKTTEFNELRSSNTYIAVSNTMLSLYKPIDTYTAIFLFMILESILLSKIKMQFFQYNIYFSYIYFKLRKITNMVFYQSNYKGLLPNL